MLERHEYSGDPVVSGAAADLLQMIRRLRQDKKIKVLLMETAYQDFPAPQYGDGPNIRHRVHRLLRRFYGRRR